jgi:hypothetical protein
MGMCIWPALFYGINGLLEQLKWGYGKRSMNVDARAIPVVQIGDMFEYKKVL